MKKLTSLVAAMALLPTFAGAQKTKNTSIYTSLNDKQCKTLKLDTSGSGFYRGECPGVAGYKLQVTEGDLRQSIDVITPAKRKFELDLIGNVSVGFSGVGPKAEWRMSGKTPVALIVRYGVSDAEDSSKITSYLVVAKITKSEICVTDVVNPGSDQNEQARKLADEAAAKACHVNPNG